MQLLRSAGLVLALVGAPLSCGSTTGPSPFAPSSFFGVFQEQSRIGAAIAHLERLESYRMDVATRQGRTMFRHELVVVRTPDTGWTLSVESASGTTRIVVLGSRAWIAEERQGFVAASVGSAEKRAQQYDLRGILRAYSGEDLSNVLKAAGADSRNGVAGDRYHAGAAELATARPGVLQTASLDVWLAPAGYLVALEAIGVENSDTDVRIDVRGANDPANRIQPPG